MTEHAIRDRVSQALKDHVAPALELDPDGIEVVAVEGGIASVRLSGACAGCGVSIQTIINGLEQGLREYVPEVEFLEAVL